MTETKTRVRLTVLGAVMLFLLFSLATRLWFLQVLATEEYASRAQGNRVRILPQAPPRGRILDRDGEILVRNRPSTILMVDRSRLPEAEKERVLGRLAELLQVDAVELGERLEDRRFYAFQPVPLAFDVPQAVASYVGEHQAELPGVTYVQGSVRDYPFQNLAAHLLGYTGEISAEELEASQFEGYDQGALIGKAGVERVYEDDLQGVQGLVNYEVNAQGDIIRPLGGRPPVPGADLVLSVNAEFQRIVQRSLREGIEQARNTIDEDRGGLLHATGGAALVMDPRTGQILAMASYPTFDPSAFIGGISVRRFNRLTAEGSNSPLFNRPIQSALPPGSTFKPFVAAAAVQEKVTNLNEFTACPPSYAVPNDPSGTEFDNWRSVDRGHLSLAEALIESCDTVFYQFGHEFNARRVTRGEIFQTHIEQFGFGRPSGIDLPNENPGLIPDAEYKKNAAKTNKFVNKFWLPGDDILMSIGQGLVQVSPLQLATGMSAIVNGGTLWEPHVGLRIQEADGDVVREIKPVKNGTVPYSRNVLDTIRNALVQVPVSGTAAGAFAGFPLSQYPVAGKTGTAEMPPLQDFSWFVAASGPAGAPPQYVVAVMIEEGGHGSTTAAPITRHILEGLFGIETTVPIAPPEGTD